MMVVTLSKDMLLRRGRKAKKIGRSKFMNVVLFSVRRFSVRRFSVRRFSAINLSYGFVDDLQHKNMHCSVIYTLWILQGLFITIALSNTLAKIHGN